VNVFLLYERRLEIRRCDSLSEADLYQTLSNAKLENTSLFVCGCDVHGRLTSLAELFSPDGGFGEVTDAKWYYRSHEK
jgi:hypothetical protein